MSLKLELLQCLGESLVALQVSMFYERETVRTYGRKVGGGGCWGAALSGPSFQGHPHLFLSPLCNRIPISVPHPPALVHVLLGNVLILREASEERLYLSPSWGWTGKPQSGLTPPWWWQPEQQPQVLKPWDDSQSHQEEGLSGPFLP